MLIIRHRLTLIVLLLFSVFTAAASSDGNTDTLSQQITAFLSEQDKNMPGRDITRKVSILPSSGKPIQACEGGKLSLTGEASLSGQQVVILHCGARRQYIRIQVEAEATYWVATRVILQNQVIRTSDVRAVKGSLAHLPRDLIFASTPVAGAVATRRINRHQPVIKNQLRKPWKITIGNAVNVVTPGKGFLIKARGKALDNAAVGAPLRVRMKSGRILTGKVLISGDVLINPTSGL